MEFFAKNKTLHTPLLPIFLVQNLSYRKATNILNRMLHRDAEQELNHTTLKDWAESFGQSISQDYLKKAESILEESGFNKDSGLAEPVSSFQMIINPNLM